jgi:hypothetical protein
MCFGPAGVSGRPPPAICFASLLLPASLSLSLSSHQISSCHIVTAALSLLQLQRAGFYSEWRVRAVLIERPASAAGCCISPSSGLVSAIESTSSLSCARRRRSFAHRLPLTALASRFPLPFFVAILSVASWKVAVVAVPCVGNTPCLPSCWKLLRAASCVCARCASDRRNQRALRDSGRSSWSRLYPGDSEATCRPLAPSSSCLCLRCSHPEALLFFLAASGSSGN